MTAFSALRLPLASLLLAGAGALAAMPAHALISWPSVGFNTDYSTCTLDASGAGDCVIPGQTEDGTIDPTQASLDYVTSNTSLVSIVSYGCAYGTGPYAPSASPCDIVVAIAPGALVGGSLDGEFTFAYTGAFGQVVVDPAFSAVLPNVVLGDPSSQGGTVYYGPNGLVIGNSGTVEADGLGGVGGITSSPPSGGSSVPAPAALGLLALGLLGVRARRQRA